MKGLYLINKLSLLITEPDYLIYKLKALSNKAFNKNEIRTTNDQICYSTSDEVNCDTGALTFDGNYEGYIEEITSHDASEELLFSRILNDLRLEQQLKCLICFYYKSRFDITATDQDFHEVKLYSKFHNQSQHTLICFEKIFDEWILESDNKLYVLHLLIKTDFYNKLGKFAKTFSVLKEYLMSTKNDDKNLFLIYKFILSSQKFSNDTSVIKLMTPQLVARIVAGQSIYKHQVFLLFFDSLIRQGKLNHFFSLYPEVFEHYTYVKKVKIRSMFRRRYVEACQNAFRFEEAKRHLGIFRFSIDRSGYLLQWRQLARNNFFLGNKIRSKILLAFLLVLFGRKALTVRDKKMLSSSLYTKLKTYLYTPINRQKYLRKLNSIANYNSSENIGGTDLMSSSNADLLRKYDFDIDSITHIEALSHLRQLFDAHMYDEAILFYNSIMINMVGYPWNRPDLSRRIEGLTYANVVRYCNTFKGAITVKSLKSELPNFVYEIPATPNSKVLVLAQFGPGDELMAISSYSNLVKWAYENQIKVTIATQKRLLLLLKRTYPEMEFVSNERLIQGALNEMVAGKYIDRKKLASTNLLSHMMDKDTESSLSDYDVVTASNFVLAQFFSPNSNRSFQVDDTLVRKHQLSIFNHIEKHNLSISKVVGLSWRSSVLSANRNIHYFLVEELAKMASVSEVLFINLQLGLTQLEKDELKSMGINFFDLETVDLRDDFESQVALISCLDAVISPISTIGELSASVGVKTYIMSPTKDLNWRVCERRLGFDILYRADALEVIFPINFENKLECIDLVCTKLSKL